MANGPILIVEDNPDDELLTLRAFKQHNVRNNVVVVRDGAEAIEFLFCTGAYENRDPGERPAVVLLDLKLPKVDGLEVLRRIREDPNTKKVPVVVLTSSKEQSDVIRSYDLGVNSYVQKPVSFEEFSKAVGELGLYWTLLNELPPE